ncbi:MAG: YcaQ family DNA glycosylase [Anaerolineae bacterium]|nr:YcaQ family DNA glycosylase [Anaerolineae bacterium]
MITLSQEAVRGLMIAALGLHQHLQMPASKEAALAVIRQLHHLPIDSINVVARAPYFVLWSRIGYCDPSWLDELMAERQIFEYWANANCFLPIEDYPLYMAGSRVIEWRNPRKWLDDHPSVTRAVLDRIRDHGETNASDFERPKDFKPTWDNPKQEQVALEYLYLLGEIMVSRRDNFQRQYDLRERVLPDYKERGVATLEEATDQFVLYSVQALGVTKAEWIADYFRLKKAPANAALKRLLKKDRLIPVRVDGWDVPAYIHPDNLKRVEAAAAGNIPQSKTTLLSPFDPLVRDRGRGIDVFNFDYKIEFYFPEKKRVYGYFSLPILYNNALIGRLDPKAHRKEGIFEVKSLHLEPGIEVDDALVTALKRTLRDCAMWHYTPQIVVRYATDADLADMLSD